MQARIARHEDVTVIYLSGRVDVETAEPFRETCLKHLANKKVVFDFKSLSFVGSSGILPFLETMQNYATGNVGLFNFSGVGTEFRRVFSATPLHTVAIYDTHLQAVEELLRPSPVISATQIVPLVNPADHPSRIAEVNQGARASEVTGAARADGATREFLDLKLQVEADGED